MFWLLFFPHVLIMNTCEEEEEDSLLSDAYSIFLILL